MVRLLVVVVGTIVRKRKEWKKKVTYLKLCNYKKICKYFMNLNFTCVAL